MIFSNSIHWKIEMHEVYLDCLKKVISFNFYYIKLFYSIIFFIISYSIQDSYWQIDFLCFNFCFYKVEIIFFKNSYQWTLFLILISPQLQIKRILNTFWLLFNFSYFINESVISLIYYYWVIKLFLLKIKDYW